MMTDSEDLSAKTWARAADSINKVGYMDGAADGQKATFQTSFDTGYKQGFNFGFEMGLKEAISGTQKNLTRSQLDDPRRINCQMCTNTNTAQENIVNLYNNQKEKNELYLKNLNKSVNS